MIRSFHTTCIRRHAALLTTVALVACAPTDSPLAPVVDALAPTAVVEVLDATGAVDADARIEVGEAFSLGGSKSTDVGGQIVRYEWSLPDGTTVAFTTPTLAVTSIVASPFAVGQHAFGLTVTDDSGNESTQAQVNVIVVDTRAPTGAIEVLDASGAVDADGTIEAGAAFSLDASGSVDAGGQIARYEWSLPDGTTVALTTPALPVTEILTTRFLPGPHTFGLTVTDDSGNESILAQIEVTIVDTQNPIAVLELFDALGQGAARIEAGAAFSLSGARSVDVLGGQIVRYNWTFPDESTLATTTPTLPVTEIVTTPLAAGQHIFRLTVTDASGNASSQALVNVIIVDTQAPTAVAEVLDASGAVALGGRIDVGAAFSLDGSRSADGGGQIVRYDWVLPDGSMAVFPTPTFAVTDFATTPFAVGRHTFELTVIDDSGNRSTPAQVRVIVVDTQAPTAVLDLRDALDRQVIDGRIESGATFSLDGSRSADAEGQIVRYDWAFPDGQKVTTVEPRLVVTTPFALGQHTFELTVTDDGGNRSTPARVTVIVVDTQPPTAVLMVTDVAGRPLVGDVRLGLAFSLSGARSADPGGEIVRYEWRLPDGGTVTTAVPTLAVTEVVTTPFGVGTHTFGLTVTDDSGNESTLARVTVTVVF